MRDITAIYGMGLIFILTAMLFGVLSAHKKDFREWQMMSTFYIFHYGMISVMLFTLIAIITNVWRL